MINLRSLIHQELLKAHPRVHFMKNPKKDYPFLVYEVSSFHDGEGFQLVTLEVDGWDNKSDLTALENLMISVKDTVNKKAVQNEKIALTFYLENEFPLTDDDVRLNRRKHVYMARLYEKE